MNTTRIIRLPSTVSKHVAIMLLGLYELLQQQQRNVSPSNSHVHQSAVAKLRDFVVGFVVIDGPPWAGRIPSVQSASWLSDCGTGHVFSKSAVLDAYSALSVCNEIAATQSDLTTTVHCTHRYVSWHISTPHQQTGRRRIFCPVTCWQAALMAK